MRSKTVRRKKTDGKMRLERTGDRVLEETAVSAVLSAPDRHGLQFVEHALRRDAHDARVASGA